MHAAHLVFFSVTPKKPPPGEVVEVLGHQAYEGAYRDHPAVKWAIKAVCALARTDWSEMWALRTRAPTRLLLDVLDMHLGQVRLWALAACATSYRSLPWGAAATLLGLRKAEADGVDDSSDAVSSDGGEPPSPRMSAGPAGGAYSPGANVGSWGSAEAERAPSDAVAPAAALSEAERAASDAGAPDALSPEAERAPSDAEPLPDAAVEAARADAAALLALCGLLQQGSVRGIRGSVVAWDTLQPKVVAGEGLPGLGDLVFSV